MNNNLNLLWENCLPILKQEITSQVSFKTWIEPLKPYSIDSSSIIFSTDNDLVKSMVTSRYMDLIKNVIKEVTGKEYLINIVLGAAPIEETKQKEAHNYSKYTFDNFIVGNSNRFAQAAALAVAEAPAAAYNPLFIYGGVGLGKTHLMHAINNFILENNKDAKIAFITSETFTNELINSFQTNSSDKFKDKYRKVDVLLIDDIQFIAGKERTEEEFFHTFNALTDANSQIVLTSDRPPNEIKTLSERLRSRFESGLICDIAPPDFETRVAILKNMAQEEKITIEDNLLHFIADRIKTNIRELEGVFKRVVALKGLLQEEITMDSVLKVLKDYTDDGKIILTPEYIVEYCSNFYNIDPTKLYSTSQKKDICNVRQIAFYLCKEILDLSYPRIGQVFNKDHTTVMHGIKKIEKSIESDASLKETVEMLIKDIKDDAAN